MEFSELGVLADLISATAVFASLIYLAVQVRQNTAQQKLEEYVSIQHGQNSVISCLLDPDMVKAYALTADGDVEESAADRARAIMWVIQYVNHFQILCDLYAAGSLDIDRFGLWRDFVVNIVASQGIRAWWDDEEGKLAFQSRVRDEIEAHLRDTENPPVPFNEMWSIFGAELWRESPPSE